MQDRFKFRVYVNQNDEYPERVGYVNTEDFYVHPDGDVGFFNADYDFAEYIIEKCTGLKDKNGRLIYENDYIKIKDTVYKVFWNKTKISLDNILKKDIIDVDITQNMDVVGNVHEVLAPVPSYDEYNEQATKCSQLEEDVKILKNQLEIATKALKKYESAAGWGREAFLALKEMEGVK